MRNKAKKIIKLGIRLFLLVIIVFNLNGTVTYAEEQKEGMDVIVVIDTSSSMDSFKRDPNRMALKVANYFIRWLPDEDLRLHVFNFSTDINVIYELNEVSASRQDKVTIENAISNLNYVGETDMGDAMEECHRIWEKIRKDEDKRKQCIVFMTDGDIDFYDEGVRTQKEKDDLIIDSRGRMEDAVKLIKCPIYVVAFGEEAENGVDANYIGNLPGNFVKYAKKDETLEDIYEIISSSLFLTKPNVDKNIEITPENNTYPLNSDTQQKELDIKITDGIGSTGNISNGQTEILVKDKETGQSFSLSDLKITDYWNELGRLLKIPEEALDNENLELVFNTASRDVIDITSYFHYDIGIQWNQEPNQVYAKKQDIELSVELSGIPTDRFAIYAIFQRKGAKESIDGIIPFEQYTISKGTAADEVALYGTQFENKSSADNPSKMSTVSGVRMEYDKEKNTYYCTVSFSEEGEYQLYLYGEDEKGFVLGDTLSFSVNDNMFVSNLLFDFVEWFTGLSLLYKVAVVLVGLGVLSIIVRIITFPFRMIRKILRLGRDNEDDDEEDEEE